jgi:hypothetical protein
MRLSKVNQENGGKVVDFLGEQLASTRIPRTSILSTRC